MQYLVEISLVEWLPGGSLRLFEKLAGVAAKIVEVLPAGIEFNEIWIERKKLKFIVNDTSQSLAVTSQSLIFTVAAIAAAITAIVAALWPLLVLIGVVIIGWKLTEVVSGVVDYFTIIAESELIKNAKEAGLTPDMINDMLGRVRGERISDVLKWISIIGGITIIGVGGIIAFKELRKVEA